MKPWISLPRILKLRPRAEIRQGYCVASEEQAFTKRIREPGALETFNRRRPQELGTKRSTQRSAVAPEDRTAKPRMKLGFP